MEFLCDCFRAGGVFLATGLAFALGTAALGWLLSWRLTSELDRDWPPGPGGDTPARLPLGYDVWWCDRWDERAGEPRGVAWSLGVCHPHTLHTVESEYGEYALRRYGPGEIVCLDARGRRVGKRIRVGELIVRLPRGVRAV